MKLSCWRVSSVKVNVNDDERLEDSGGTVQRFTVQGGGGTVLHIRRLLFIFSFQREHVIAEPNIWLDKGEKIASVSFNRQRQQQKSPHVRISKNMVLPKTITHMTDQSPDQNKGPRQGL